MSAAAAAAAAKNEAMIDDPVWQVGNERSAEHPTAKPVELWKPQIANHTHAGAVVYEPFSGSGSQIIAAEQLERRCFAMEIDPGYVRAAVTRWEQFTGRKAKVEHG